ncbi:hypothetical protein B0H14DRAFT_2639890 [Mycena olivaceomarginata]|nr:hypothetical protein B0H14DRAFT_2639890 [Mycena olivaceomarginata]
MRNKRRENKGLLAFVRKKHSSNITITSQAQAEGFATAKRAVLMVQMNNAGKTWDVPADEGLSAVTSLVVDAPGAAGTICPRWSTGAIRTQKSGVLAWDDGIYEGYKMDMDSQKHLVGQIEGFVKNLGDFSTEEARKLLEFFDSKIISPVFGNRGCSFSRVFPKFNALLRPRWTRFILVRPIQTFLRRRSRLMSLRSTALEEVKQGSKIPTGSGLRSAGVTDEWVLEDSGPVVDGQILLRVEQELSPERLEFFRELRHSMQPIRAQRGGHFTNPSSNAITSHRKTGASTEELLSGKLIIGAGSGRSGNKFVTTYKKD